MKNLYLNECLKQKVVEACGCTEPIAIAYASAVAAKYLKGVPQKVYLSISPNVIKNAMIVCLPGTEGRFGIQLASAMGLLYGNADACLNVIEGLSKEQIDEAEKFSSNVELDFCPSPFVLYIEVKVTSGEHFSKVIIEGTHTNVAYIENDSGVISDTRTKPEDENAKADFDLEDIYKYSVSEFKDYDFIKKIIDINSAMMDEGLKNGHGLCVGKCLDDGGDGKEEILLKNLNYILKCTTASVDARMAGVNLPVMSNSGSGNQGLVTTIPVIAAAKVLGSDTMTTYKAVLISSLVTIYTKSKHNVLTAYCGAALATTGVSAGLVYLMGGGVNEIKKAVQNNIGNIFGILCDGAKETCALKVANCTFSAIYSAYLAIKNRYPHIKEGVISDSAEKTLDNVARLSKETSSYLDAALLKIMLE